MHKLLFNFVLAFICVNPTRSLHRCGAENEVLRRSSLCALDKVELDGW
jgi:hypothetical protein